MKAAFEAGLHKRLKKSPELAATLLDVQDKLRRGGYYDPGVVDFAFQDYRGWVSLEAAYVFAQIWTLAHTGQLWLAEIPVGCAPYSDAAEDMNRAALARLPEGFSADVWFGKALQDGNLHWRFDLGLFSWVDSPRGESCTCGCGSAAKVQIHKFFKANTAPLEVGTTAPHKTMEHLWTQRSLARWAYDSDKIILGIVDPPIGLDQEEAYDANPR